MKNIFIYILFLFLPAITFSQGKPVDGRIDIAVGGAEDEIEIVNPSNATSSYNASSYSGDRLHQRVINDGTLPMTITGMNTPDIIVPPNQSVTLTFDDDGWWTEKNETYDNLHQNSYVSNNFTLFPTPTNGDVATRTYTWTGSNPANGTVTVPAATDPSTERYWVINDSPNGTDLVIDASAVLFGAGSTNGIDNDSPTVIPPNCKADIQYDEFGEKIFVHLFCTDIAAEQDTCLNNVTRAQLISLRNTSELDTDCHYVIAGLSIGTLGAIEIQLHASSENELSMIASVATTFDNSSWLGTYDIDANRIIHLEDNLSNVVYGNSVSSFPWGVNSVNNNDVRGNINWTAGTLSGNEIAINSNVTISGGSLTESSIEEDGEITIISGSNTENKILTSAVYRQVGTGRLNFSTIGNSSIVTNGNTNISNLITDNMRMNTTGSTGSISGGFYSESNLNALQNIPSLTLSRYNITSTSTISANGATRLYLVNGSLASSRILISASATLNANYTDVDSYGYIQVTNGVLTANYNKISSLGYLQHTSTGTNFADRNTISSGGSNIRFLGTSNNCRVYYSKVSSGATIYHTGASTGCLIYYSSATDGGLLYTNGSTNNRMYYCAANSRGRVISQNCTGTGLLYYCNGSASGQVISINNSGLHRMFSITAQSQGIARLQNCAVSSNIYYSKFDSYYYGYITLTTAGTKFGFYGSGRRTNTVTNPNSIAPYAIGTSWQNF